MGEATGQIIAAIREQEEENLRLAFRGETMDVYYKGIHDGLQKARLYLMRVLNES